MPYKICRRKHGKLVSMYNYVEMDYVLGETTTRRDDSGALAAFSSLNAAKRYVENSGGKYWNHEFAIFEVEVTPYTGDKVKGVSLFKPIEIGNKYSFEPTHDGYKYPDWNMPRCTIYCNTIKLIKEVDNG